jgi:hypothetical protein
MNEEPHEDVGKTGAIDLGMIAATRTTATSEKPSGDPPIPVERYAMVVACTDGAPPHRRAEIHRQAGIESEEQRRTIDQVYGRFLRSVPEVKEQFVRELKRWQDWLAGEGRR